MFVACSYRNGFEDIGKSGLNGMHGFGILDFGRTSSIATNALTCLHYQLTGLWPWEVAGKVVGGFPAASCVLINSKMNKTCKVSVLANGSWIV